MFTPVEIAKLLHIEHPSDLFLRNIKKINKHFMMKPSELLFLWASSDVGSYFTEEVCVNGLIEPRKCSENFRDKNIFSRCSCRSFSMNRYLIINFSNLSFSTSSEIQDLNRTFSMKNRFLIPSYIAYIV